MKRILVTGGAGFVGSNLIENLQSYSKFNITSLDCYFTGTEKNHIKGVNYIKGYTWDIEKHFKIGKSLSAEKIFKKIEKKITWLKVNYGEAILFNPALPHGARKNLENETRFSLNCRFKGIFTPYGDKKIGEYFEPITLKPMSRLGFKNINEKKI